VGGLLGGLIGAIVGASGALVLLSHHPLLGALEGGFLGGVLGVVFGAVRGVGWWRQKVDLPAATPVRGNVLIGVSASRGRLEEIRPVLEQTGGKRIELSTRPADERARDEVIHHQH